jgi:prepilin-type N-terminal cleavage/methylation domain-containing protein
MDKYLCKNEAFTLLEVILVLSLLGIILGLTSVFSLSFYRSEGFYAEHNRIMAALQTARANAIMGVSGAAHGVRFDGDGVYSFVGESFDTSYVETRTFSPYVYPVVIASSSATDVVFQARSGQSEESIVSIVDRGRPTVVHLVKINHEGYIGK